MHIGLLQVEVYLPVNNTLKGKRRVVQSIKDKLRRRYNISIAEVSDQNKRKISVLAITTVSNDNAQVHWILNNVLSEIETVPDLIVLNHRLEMF